MQQAGEPAGLEADALFAEVYERLKAMAGSQLGATAAVDARYDRARARVLPAHLGEHELVFAQPVQFFTYAARAMRHLLADRARDRLRQRAGGDWMRVTLTGSDERLAIDSAEQALELDEAMQKLERADARAAHVVELLYFAGLDPEQIAEALDIGPRTVARDWRFARAFLKSELGGKTCRGRRIARHPALPRTP